MINIFGEGPYLSLGELFGGSARELGKYYLHFFLFLAAVLLLKTLILKCTKRLKHTEKSKHNEKSKRIELAAAVLLPVLQIMYVWSVSIKSEFLYSFFLAFLITAQVRILNLIPLKALDYAFLFTAMLFPNRLFDTTSALLGHLWFFWILFCVIYTTARLGIHHLGGHHFVCYFLFVFLSLSMYSYSLAAHFFYPALSKLAESSAFGIVCFISAILTLLSGLTWLVKVRFNDRLMKLNSLGRKYRTIERYFFSFSLLILLIFTLIFLPFSIMQLQNTAVMLLFPCLCLTLLWVQMPFIVLLFRVAFYKDNATFYEWEREGIASYYKELTGNLTAMQEMRHDIKNIFFTMGNFVERSNDTEMKHFFWDKIYPYSVETIHQSELLSKLYQVPVESLRAFFHLKLSQALSQKITVGMEVHIIPETFQTGMDVIDLTRILGILLDNAIEETIQIPDGRIELKIIGNDEDCSYIIKNSITAQTTMRGIYAGNTSKGPGRGKGLQIVQQLLAQYHNLELNSSMQQHTYVQSLNIIYYNS